MILDQELIHDSQDKPIDLNQGKKEFAIERSEYQVKVQSWHSDYTRRCQILDLSRQSRHRDVQMNTGAAEFYGGPDPQYDY